METILVDTKKLEKLLSVSRKTAEKIGDKAGARIKIGRAVRWDVSKIKKYLEESR